MGVLFILELTIAIVIFATGDKIIDAVIDKTQAYDEWNTLKDYLTYVDLVVVATLAVQLFLIIFVKCYIGSLKDRNAEYDYKFIDDGGNKISLQEKQRRDEDVIHDKYAQKREDMRQKYGRN